jgi:hypothetical protein
VTQFINQRWPTRDRSELDISSLSKWVNRFSDPPENRLGPQARDAAAELTAVVTIVLGGLELKFRLIEMACLNSIAAGELLPVRHQAAVLCGFCWQMLARKLDWCFVR